MQTLCLIGHTCSFSPRQNFSVQWEVCLRHGYESCEFLSHILSLCHPLKNGHLSCTQDMSSPWCNNIINIFYWLEDTQIGRRKILSKYFFLKGKCGQKQWEKTSIHIISTYCPELAYIGMCLSPRLTRGWWTLEDPGLLLALRFHLEVKCDTEQVSPGFRFHWKRGKQMRKCR